MKPTLKLKFRHNARLFVAISLFPFSNVEGASRLLALAAEERLPLMIGRYDSTGGWESSRDFYTPPEPGNPFVLYGPTGLSGAVIIVDKEREIADSQFFAWSARISPWDDKSFPFALALSGEALPPQAPLQPASLEAPELRAIVSRYLKKKGLNVEAPVLTQAFHFPLHEKNKRLVFLAARSPAPKDDQAGAVYDVALLWWKDGDKEQILSLATFASLKTKDQTVEDHQKWNGMRERLTLVSAVDVDGDGWNELVLLHEQDAAMQVDLFTFNGRLRKVISVYKQAYN